MEEKNTRHLIEQAIDDSLHQMLGSRVSRIDRAILASRIEDVLTQRITAYMNSVKDEFERIESALSAASAEELELLHSLVSYLVANHVAYGFIQIPMSEVIDVRRFLQIEQVGTEYVIRASNEPIEDE